MTETMLVTYPENLQQAIKETLSWQSETNKKGLSTREFEVLYFISLGWDETDMTQALKMTRNTFRSHTRSILNKLNAQNRTEALAKAFRCGLLA